MAFSFFFFSPLLPTHCDRYKARFNWEHYTHAISPGAREELPAETHACASVTSAFLQVRPSPLHPDPPRKAIVPKPFFCCLRLHPFASLASFFFRRFRAHFSETVGAEVITPPRRRFSPPDR